MMINGIVEPVYPTNVTVTWLDGTKKEFTKDDLLGMSDEDFRWWLVCILCGNWNDPDFREKWKPAKEGS